MAALPLSRLRTASMTSAPAAASRRVIPKPIPLFAPVTTASVPVWSGMTMSFSIRMGVFLSCCMMHSF